MQQVHVGDVGIVFVVTVRVSGVARDISSATTQLLTFLSPDGTSSDKTTVFYTDGTDGKIKHVVDDSELLHEPGYWKLQPYIEIGDAVIINGEVEIVEVFSNI